jgi:hypothetical protein
MRHRLAGLVHAEEDVVLAPVYRLVDRDGFVETLQHVAQQRFARAQLFFGVLVGGYVVVDRDDVLGAEAGDAILVPAREAVVDVGPGRKEGRFAGLPNTTQNRNESEFLDARP